MKKPAINQSKSPSQLITERISELGDWRGETLAHVRKLIKEADPKITKNGSGGEFQSGLTAGSSARASPTRLS